MTERGEELLDTLARGVTPDGQRANPDKVVDALLREFFGKPKPRNGKESR